MNAWIGICYTLNDPSNKILFPNKTEDLHLSVFIRAEINESNISKIYIMWI